MAPISLLCNTVLRSFVQREKLVADVANTVIEDESENEVEKESDDEVSGIQMVKSTKESSSGKKKRKENFRHVLEERLDWNKLLIE